MDFDNITEADEWPLVGGLIAFVAHTGVGLDTLAQMALEWFPVVSLSYKLNPEFGEIVPQGSLEAAMVLTGIVVLLWRANGAVEWTVEKVTGGENDD